MVMKIARVVMPEELNDIFTSIVEGQRDRLRPRSGSFTSLCLSIIHRRWFVIDDILTQIFITIKPNGKLSEFTYFWLEVLISFLSGIHLDCFSSEAKKANSCKIDSLHLVLRVFVVCFN